MLGSTPAGPRNVPSEKNPVVFGEKTQLLCSGAKAKGYSTPVLVLFMGLLGVALEFWPTFLHAPSRGRHVATENNESPFSAPK